MKKLNIMLFKRLTILLLLLCAAGAGYAQEFKAFVNTNKVAQGQRFQLSFQFSGSDINSLSDFTPPDLSDFRVLSGPNQSSSMQIINGQVSASRTFSFYLQPVKTGTFTIGPASIKSGGTTYRTEALQVEVVQGNASQPADAGESDVDMKEIAENLFIRAIVNKRDVYVGEQVTVEYKLYTRLNIASSQISKLPSYQGFWVEELQSPQSINFSVEVYNGKQFKVALLKRAALFPSRSGELTVSPMELQVPVVLERRRRGIDDFFSSPFFNRTETIEFIAKSNEVTVNAKALPPNNAESFSGAAGKYSMSVNVDKTTVQRDEPVTLTVNVSGTGNIGLLQLPDIQFPAGFETYEPEVSESISSDNTISGRKTFEYLLIPRRTGRIDIPAIEFTYFDFAKEQYVTLDHEPVPIKIEGGAPTAANRPDGSVRQGITKLDTDIRFIKTGSGNLTKKGDYLFTSFQFLVMLFLPLVIVVALVGWKKRDDKLSADTMLMRLRKARKMAKNRLKTAAQYLKEHKVEEFYNEVTLAVTHYLQDKLTISPAEFTLESTCQMLEEEGADKELVQELKQLIEKCEFIRFAPGGRDDTEMQNTFKEASEIIVRLEDALASRKGKE